jgi:hypothetical protein
MQKTILQSQESELRVNFLNTLARGSGSGSDVANAYPDREGHTYADSWR